MFTSFKFWWNTSFRPRFVPHYWCEFWDFREQKKNIGWYILNRKGNMIPWVHVSPTDIRYRDKDDITKIAPPIE